jgi:hypothetical protein
MKINKDPESIKDILKKIIAKEKVKDKIAIIRKREKKRS